MGNNVGSCWNFLLFFWFHLTDPCYGLTSEYLSCWCTTMDYCPSTFFFLSETLRRAPFFKKYLSLTVELMKTSDSGRDKRKVIITFWNPSRILCFNVRRMWWMDFRVWEILPVCLQFLGSSPQLLGRSLSLLQQVGVSEFSHNHMELTWLILSKRQLFNTTFVIPLIYA